MAESRSLFAFPEIPGGSGFHHALGSEAIARFVIAWLRQRKGFDAWWCGLDLDIQEEILVSLTNELEVWRATPTTPGGVYALADEVGSASDARFIDRVNREAAALERAEREPGGSE